MNHGLRRLIELQRGSIHAIAQSSWLGTVIENMSEMPATTFAEHFRTRGKERVVFFSFDRVFRDRLVKTRPTRAGIKLRIRTEQFLSAGGAFEDAVIMHLIKRAAERALGSFAS